jgi:hypothetical protein
VRSGDPTPGQWSGLARRGSARISPRPSRATRRGLRTRRCPSTRCRSARASFTHSRHARSRGGEVWDGAATVPHHHETCRDESAWRSSRLGPGSP